MQQIWTQPQASVEDFEQNIDRENFIKICSWILEYYGGTASHKFLLKFNPIFLSLSVEELKKCINMMSHSKSLGVDSLIAFYGFYTNVNSDNFEGLEVDDEVNRYIGKNLLNEHANALMFKQLGLDNAIIKQLKSIVVLEREKQVV